LICLAGSAGVHALFGFPLKDLAETYLNSGDGAPPVKVVQLSPERWSRSFQTSPSSSEDKARRLARLKADAIAGVPLPDLAAQPRPEKEPELEKKPEPARPHGPVVQVPPTADDRPDPNARFAAEHNSRVEKESVARIEDTSSDPSVRPTHKLQKRRAPDQSPNAIPSSQGLSVKGDGEVETREGKPGEGKSAFLVPDILRRDAVELDTNIDGDLLSIRNRSATDGISLGNSPDGDGQAGEDAQKKGAKDGAETQQPIPTLAALMPTLGTVAPISGAPRWIDNPDIPEGEGTFLNTKEFKYATFINRVGDSVWQYWNGYVDTEYRRRDPSGRIYGRKNRSTVVQLEINLEGQVEGVHVAESSGVDFLDEVVVRAVQKAQPFPNPPAAMADPDGVIRMYYRFIVVMRSRGLGNLGPIQ
jgi:TonB family protein